MSARRLRLLFALCLALAPASFAVAQSESDPESEADGEPEEGYTLTEYEEETGVYNRRFWALEFGPSFPVGSSERIYIPTNIIGVNPPEPYSEFYREGYSVNIATGVMTELGFEASLSFRITKINFTNRATAQILSDSRDNLNETTYSSYLLGTQLYLGQRLKPITERGESLFFGVGLELGAVKHYSERFSADDDASFALSVIAGDEIPLQRDPDNFSMLTLRIQTEFVALANEERPRFVHLTFGIRGYLP